MDYAFEYWQKYGAEKESDYPYTATDDSCKYNAGSVVTKVAGFKDVATNEAELKKASAGRVVSVAVDANTWQWYSGGIISKSSCGSSLDHGVTLTGYGVDGSSKYWRIKNSWNTWWGESGYVRLERTDSSSSGGTCGVATSASYPTL